MVTVPRDRAAIRLAAITVAVTVLIPAAAHSQESVVRARRITCGTTTGPRVQCLTGGNASIVRLVRDLSSLRQCRQSANWGYDRTAIWVDRGCQAEFEVIPSSAPAQPEPGSATRRIACGSVGGAQVECKTNGEATNVVLLRDLNGRSQCRQGFNWGFTNALIWTNRGCRAEFEITYQASPSDGNTRRITCGVTTGARVSCNPFGVVSNVVLIRDLSGGSVCRRNYNWGFTKSDIWTTRGCKAEFEVTYLNAPAAGNPRRISCGSTAGAQLECKTNGEAINVVLIRDLTGRNRCRQGTNWGFTDSFIWANGGCRGEFEVTYSDKVQMVHPR